MSDVEGIVERLRDAVFSENPGEPLDADVCAALCEQAADEIERLNAALQYEQHRSGRIGTHGVGCWAWGPQHYECVLSELQSRDATISRLEGELDEYGEIGERDGYEKAVQDIDLLTGGDGEYRAAHPSSGRHCPDPDAMKARITARFAEGGEAVARLAEQRRTTQALGSPHYSILAERCAAAEARAQKAEAALGEAVKVVERLTSAAKLLQANSEGCAVNHYGEDFGLHGMPGFLIDTQADIEAARTFSKQEGGK